MDLSSSLAPHPHSGLSSKLGSNGPVPWSLPDLSPACCCLPYFTSSSEAPRPVVSPYLDLHYFLFGSDKYMFPFMASLRAHGQEKSFSENALRVHNCTFYNVGSGLISMIFGMLRAGLCVSGLSSSISGAQTAVSASQAVVKQNAGGHVRCLPPSSADTAESCGKPQQTLFSSSRSELILHLIWVSFQPQGCLLGDGCSGRHFTCCERQM